MGWLKSVHCIEIPVRRPLESFTTILQFPVFLMFHRREMEVNVKLLMQERLTTLSDI